MLKDRLQREHAAVSRQRVKRKLLDGLDALHKFTPPPSLVEDEFSNVWKTILDDLQAQKRTFEDEGTTEEKAKDEYRGIAERRVRLGLVIAEIGEKNGIKVSDEELSRAVMDRARQVPGREQQVWDYYRNNPDAVASLRAPIFEDKVVDFLLELAQDHGEVRVARGAVQGRRELRRRHLRQRCRGAVPCAASPSPYLPSCGLRRARDARKLRRRTNSRIAGPSHRACANLYSCETFRFGRPSRGSLRRRDEKPC